MTERDHSELKGSLAAKSVDPYLRPDLEQVWELPGEFPGEPATPLRVQSLRRLRKTIVLTIWGVTLGVLLIVFNSPYRNDLVAPGPLNSQHAQILAGMGGDRCAACHDAGNRSWLSWTDRLWGNSASCPTSQSELCLDCHRQTIDPALAANPHTLDHAQLARLTARQEEKFRLAGLELPAEHSSRQLACAACHIEHQGSESRLTAVSDNQCQTCHAQRHHSFEDGHPDFQLVGTDLPSAIKFDHQTHLKKYFPEGKQEFACAQCHVGDSQRNVMKLTSYEVMCSSCHEQTIRTTGQQGVVLLELPCLDLERLQEVGVELGSWPKGAQGDFAGRLHPLTWALLARDEALADTLQAFPAGFDFGDIDPNDQDQIRRLGVLARALKQLMLDLAAKDLSELLEPVQSGAASPRLSDSSHQVFRDAIANWFPEMAASGGWAQLDRDENRGSAGSWIPPSQAVARWLQEQELLVPNPLVGKVSPAIPSKEITGQVELPQAVPAAQPTADAGSSRQATSQAGVTNPEPLVDETSGRGSVNPLPALRNEQENLAGANPTESSEWLARNPLQDLFQPEQLRKRSPGEFQQAQQTDSINNLELQRNPNAPPHKAAVSQSSQAPAIEPVFSAPAPNLIPRATLARGWSRDDQTYRLVYSVADHADPLWPQLSLWLDRLQQSDTRQAADVLAHWIGQPGAAGACFSCHRAGGSPSPRETYTQRWTSELRSELPRGFTRFNHAPHLLQLQCTDCHRMTEPKPDSKKGQLASWSARESLNVNQTGAKVLPGNSDFAAIQRSTCVQCHQRNQASNTCTTCHQYHVGEQGGGPPRER